MAKNEFYEPECQIRRIEWDGKYVYRIYATDIDNRWRRFGQRQFSTERGAQMHIEIQLSGYKQKPTVVVKPDGTHHAT